MHAKVNPVPPSSARRPTRPIRALSRGLLVLAELNRRERAPIHTLSSAVRLPRTTTFRILETLRLAGYVERCVDDDCYRPTLKVRALADGFDDEAMIAHIAKRHLDELAAAIVWPIEVATPAGGAMRLRERSQSPFALEPSHAGDAIPMLTSAAGRAFLAFSRTAQRERVLHLLAQAASSGERLARDRPEIERIVQETRAQGFGLSQRARRISQEISLALPLKASERVLATLAVRFAGTAVPLRSAIDQFLPKMREIAIKIEAEFAQTLSHPPLTQGAADGGPADYLVNTLLTPPEMSEVTSSSAPASPSPPGAAK
jgi:IclR family transcriptional regulator, mhp operon transcriptional activator